MRLLFLSNFYPPYAIGGYEQRCQDVATALVKRGHSVHVLTSRYGLERMPGPEARPPAADASPAVQRTLYLMTGLDYYEPLRFLTRWQREEASNQGQLMAAIDAVQPDLLVVWGMWNLSLKLPYWAEQRLPGRVAYTISSYWPTDVDPHHAYWGAPARSRLGRLLKRPLQQWAQMQLQAAAYPPPLRFEHATCISRHVRDALVRAGAVPPETGVLYGGTDPAPFLTAAAERKPAADGRLRLLYVGRLVQDKGVHTVLEALTLLGQQIDLAQLQLTVVGSGHPAYEAYLQKMVRDSGLSTIVVFAGAAPHRDIPHILAQHDIFLFPSIWAEPLARSVMEAMAAGLLVIGSEVGGQVEMLCDGVNSFTFPAGDARALASQIARAIADPQQSAQLAAAGRDLVLREFTLDRMVTGMESWFQSIAAGATHPSAGSFAAAVEPGALRR